MNSNNQENLKNMKKPYKNLSRSEIMRIHQFTLDIRREKNIGQRKIAEEIKKKFNINFSENTISGWIHRHIIPFANEKTQFKPKPKPPKNELYKLYIKDKISSSRIAKKYKVSTIIVINWLKKYNIKVRNHTESMNTPKIKKELADLKLTKPTKNYDFLTPEKAYIFGVLCGDAYIDQNFVKLEIRNDHDFIEEFIRCFKKVYGIDYNYYYYKKRNSLISNITSRIICSDLMKHGTFRTKSWEVPKNVLESKEEYIKSSFLKGVYDSEGSVSKYTINLTSISEKGIQGIMQLLDDLNIESTRYCYNGYPQICIKRRYNLKLFKEKVGFNIKRKMEKLK
tara:strand:- start:337 stop:1350 length:1014 start_codon:yes stop_codon:yes gene_type:complete